MTSYHGGKQRIGRDIAENIYHIATMMEDEDNFSFRGYCEPFTGMCGVYQHIPELFGDHRSRLTYKAGDINKSVIMMWQAAQKGWKPPTQCSKSEFERLRYSKPSAKKGFIGHQCSFGSINFGGFTKSRTTQSKMKHASNNVSRVADELSDVKFTSGQYTQFSKLKGYIIYCDPPYQTNSNYYDEAHKMLSFDHEKFWDWCRMMSQNNLVFVSEYKVPRGIDMEKVASIKSHVSYGKGRQLVNKENLYVVV